MTNGAVSPPWVIVLDVGLRAGGDNRRAGHDSALAPRVGGPQVDVRPSTRRASRPAGTPSVARRSYGDGQSVVGLHAHPGGAEEPRHRVGRSTIARILKAQGIPPSRQRPLAWRTFIRAHWSALLAADFFTTEVWTSRGLVTYYTAFVIELHSRRVQILGSTPNPDEAFVLQTIRPLTSEIDGVLGNGRVLICDRDPKWSSAVRRFLEEAGVRVIRTPARAPNCNAYAERFVRSIKEECLDRIVPLGERHLRRTLTEFAAHYHGERNHQGLGNDLIDGPPPQRASGSVWCRQRLGGDSATTIGQPRSAFPTIQFWDIAALRTCVFTAALET